MVEQAAEVDRRLANANDNLVDRERTEDVPADRLGHRLEQPIRDGFDVPAHHLVDLAVVDGLREVVARPGGSQIEHELDVHLERLGHVLLVVVPTMAALELDVAEDDPVAQGTSPSPGSAPRGAPGAAPARTIASAGRAARTFGWTSWTRTMSTPAAMPRA